jgi:hypothetical protein
MVGAMTGTLPERVPLPGGHTLTVRAAEPGDEAALAVLYQQLSPRDRHRRFFSAYQPTAARLTRWVTVEQKGGYRIVAVTDDGRIVGDCGYFRDGPDAVDGELDMTVEDDERGWLGPYLLDTLVGVARAHGIVSLRAEVLIENGPMLSLLHARGAASAGHDDPSTTSLRIGVRDTVPQWPERAAGTERVLVESRSSEWPGAASLRSAGLDVLVCPGPHTGAHRFCPVVDGRSCPLADGADAIVFALDERDDEARVVLDDHAPHDGAAALCAEPRHPDADEAFPTGTTILDPGDPLSGQAVWQAMGHDGPLLPKRRQHKDRADVRP